MNKFLFIYLFVINLISLIFFYNKGVEVCEDIHIYVNVEIFLSNLFDQKNKRFRTNVVFHLSIMNKTKSLLMLNIKC